MKLTQKRLKDVLDYNPDTGVFTWRVYRGRKAMIGSTSGTITKAGRLRIQIDGYCFLAHRLAWLYVYGYIPENEIDHIDRDPMNNRIKNLREASRLCNARNVGTRKDNTSGIIGVCWYPSTKKWTAQISHKGKRLRLGYFKSKLDAAKSRYEAETTYGWNSCNTVSSALEYILKHEPGYDTEK